MSGIGYWVKFRLTPTDGDVVDLDFGGVGPGSLLYLPFPTRCNIDYALDIKDRSDINQRKRPLYRGVRRTIALDVAIGGETNEIANDHGMLTQVVNAFFTSGTMVEASVDNGQTWFEVVMTRYRGPDGFGGKLHQGAKFTLEMEQAELMQLVPTLTDTYTEGVPSGM